MCLCVQVCIRLFHFYISSYCFCCRNLPFYRTILVDTLCGDLILFIYSSEHINITYTLVHTMTLFFSIFFAYVRLQNIFCFAFLFILKNKTFECIYKYHTYLLAITILLLLLLPLHFFFTLIDNANSTKIRRI